MMPGAYSGGPPATRGGNGVAVAAMVCGIVGVFIFNVVLGPLAVIFGGVGLRNANRGAGRRGAATAGLVLGIVDIVLLIVVIAAASGHSFSWHAG
jgi:hypothetical protein